MARRSTVRCVEEFIGRGAERPARSAHPTRSTRRFAGGGYWLLPRPILVVVARRSPLISGIIGGAADVVDPIVTTCTLGPLVTTPSELAAFQRDIYIVENK